MSTEAQRPQPPAPTAPETETETTARLRPVRTSQPPAPTPAQPLAPATPPPPQQPTSQRPTPPAAHPHGAPIPTGTPARPNRPGPTPGVPPQPARHGTTAGAPAPAPQAPGAPDAPAPAASPATGLTDGRPEAGTPSRPATAEPGAGTPGGPGMRDQPGAGTPSGPGMRDQPGAPAGRPGVPPQPDRPGPTPAVPPQPRPTGHWATSAAPAQPQHPRLHWAPPETPFETTTRLRPIRTRRPARTVAAVTCLVLGLGLIGGAAAGAWFLSDADDRPSRTAYTETPTLWHSTPVDTLFPRTLKGDGAGPGGADRIWTRVAVAPDTTCATALGPQLSEALDPTGCLRVLRATYTDATSSSVTTVGLVFTETDSTGMTALHTRFTDGGLDRRADLMPPAFRALGTVAAGFGNPQRASWHVHVLTELPVVVYAVSGFADGRAVTAPQPAQEAMAKGQTTAPAQAGLGHEARGVADRIEQLLRRTVTAKVEGPQEEPQ
ncbi:hypothetical protein [Streptomyces coeruleoprunus]|uniref:hypothetical protein n=1 Tax=Streptomyces coeruleoprunus TaxID=285563 RepID=UPI0035E70F69